MVSRRDEAYNRPFDAGGGRVGGGVVSRVLV